MYKDKDKQREANKEQMRRARAKGNTKQGNTVSGNTSKEHSYECDPETLAVFKQSQIAKRGKDIKCFEDLPPDVQQTIKNISESNEEFQRRTGIAIRYQHIFPNRFHSVGVAI